MTKQIVWVAATVALLSRGGSPDITGDWSVVAISTALMGMEPYSFTQTKCSRASATTAAQQHVNKRFLDYPLAVAELARLGL